MTEELSQEPPKKKLRGKNLEVTLRALIDPIVSAAGLDLIEFRMLRSPRGGVRLQLFVDRFAGEGGVLVDDCASISRKIGAVLEIEDPISSAYDLEVSSPGMKRLLRHIGDARRFIGVRARLTLPEQPDAPRRTLIGELADCDDDASVTIIVDGGKTETITFASLHRAMLDPTLAQWQQMGAQQQAERDQRATAQHTASDTNVPAAN